MANILALKDGSTRTVEGLDDIREIIEEELGSDIASALDDELSGLDEWEIAYQDLEGEMNGKVAHYKEVMQTLRSLSETIAGLIKEKDIDRRALSDAAGQIGVLTWKELS